MRKTKISLLALLYISLYACSSATPKSSTVGYQELASSIKSGQRLQLLTNEKKIINIKVNSLSGDIISGTRLDGSNKKIQINLNDISKVRLY